jgi:hypothetical protein
MASKASKRDKKRQLIAGIGIHFAKVKSVTLKGKEVKLGTFVAALNKSIAAAADTDAKRVAFLESAKASRDAEAAVTPTMVAFTDYLQSTMSPSELADFNLQPKTRLTPNVATKAVAVKKSAATRKARGTMGKRQREKIVGVVEDGAPPAPAAANGAAKAAG